MPVMPRFKSDATKIAYDILGKPPNMRPKTKNSKVKKQLQFEQTTRVR